MRQPVQLIECIRGPYDHVAPILRLDFDFIVRDPLAELRVHVGGGSVGRSVDAQVGPIEFSVPPQRVEIPLRCQAAEHPAFFPTMHGCLHLADAGDNMIELRLVGEYAPPFGAAGAVADRFAGHEAATASLRAYLVEVAKRFEAKLAEHTWPVPPRPVRSDAAAQPSPQPTANPRS